MILENLKSENLKEKKHKNSKSKVIVLCDMAGILLCVMILYGVFIMDTGKKEKEGTTLTIAISSDTRISNLDTNYYKEWLEQQTGDTIQFEYIYRGFEKEYLNAMLTTEHNTIDAVFLPEEQKLLSKEEFEHFVSQGLIFDLSGCQTPESNLTHIVEEYGNKSEALYYFPGIDTSRKSQNLQVLWINVSWLKALGLQVPRTTEELALVLQAFKEGDPNGNGLQDELPLICCQAEETFCSYDYLLNAYTYYDPTSAGIYQDEQGNVVYAPITD